ncbi:10948_t:CDS:2 [Entrophospora sp. SA101]|nr:10948_t:CDS:2 [Entrophospora sp. SA101]
MVNLLSPFEKVTRRFCGAKYVTLSLVNPYMELLKKTFAPKSENGESLDTYLDLIYGPQTEDNNDNEEESDSSTSDDDEIPSGGIRGAIDDIDDINHVEYLPAVNTTGLLQKVQAAIFLSLDELWSVPTELVQIATVLDPRFKNFQWDRSGEERDKSHQLLRELYDFTKVDFESNNIQQTTTIHNLHTTNEDDNDDFFETLEIDLSSFEVENDDDELQISAQFWYLRHNKHGV